MLYPLNQRFPYAIKSLIANRVVPKTTYDRLQSFFIDVERRGVEVELGIGGGVYV